MRTTTTATVTFDPLKHHLVPLAAPPEDLGSGIVDVVVPMPLRYTQPLDLAHDGGGELRYVAWHERSRFDAGLPLVTFCCLYKPERLPLDASELAHPRNSPPNFTGPVNAAGVVFAELFAEAGGTHTVSVTA